MLKAFRLLFAGSCTIAIVTPSTAADTDHGKEIATRWCASCHLIERGQTSATDQAPPFTYLAGTPGFDGTSLHFCSSCHIRTCQMCRSIGQKLQIWQTISGRSNETRAHARQRFSPREDGHPMRCGCGDLRRIT